MRRWLGVATLCCLLTLTACDRSSVGPTLQPPAAIPLPHAGFGGFVFTAVPRRPHAVYLYRAQHFDARHGAIWFIMHGAQRDAARYLRLAAPVAERYGALAVAIQFSRRWYASGDDYTLGGETPQPDSTGEHSPAAGPADAPYAVVEAVFDALRAELRGAQPGYYLYGHSAGAQFVHRLLTFLPRARVLGAVAANAGWYTLPEWGDDAALQWPYGLSGSGLSRAHRADLLRKPLTVLLGTRDVDTAAADPLLRDTPEAATQGPDRLRRGERYYASALQAAREEDEALAWRLYKAPGAGHSAAETIVSAAWLLFAGQEPCAPSSASQARGLTFTEVLADPPLGMAGDMNGDGRRDPVQDEFVELHNAGAAPVCLTGWSLRDGSGRRRHLFPLGAALDPGATLVLFGGGVPTGRFAGAQVQWASNARGLSLTRQGDRLVLADHDGHTALTVAWGACSEQPCAEQQIAGDLSGRVSMVRPPGDHGPWRRHDQVDGTRASPGSQPGRR